ncbi:hypothetical protein SEA_PRAIRIE_45 [Arthrobacter phage Prairie]|uniref:Uncharacterized protein n=1 Tax=Arthrobacter phage Prairie TaxID=2816463 RepID=A0A8A5LRQ3_9CAUD|nr:hypothetical protein SEA_PRAIRIE_45 [Arthrobacter phage Prairie]
MKIAITIESDEIGTIEISNGYVLREYGDNPRAVAAEILVDTLVPRALGALQVRPADDPAEVPYETTPEAPVSESIDE